MAGRESRERPAFGAARDYRLKRFELKTENRSRNNGSGQRFIASNGDSRHPTAEFRIIGGDKSGRGGTPPLPHHEACRLLALRGFRNSAPFVQRVLGFFSRRIRFGTLRPYLGTPLRRLLSPSFHGFPLHFSCPSSVRSKSMNGLRIPPFAALWRLLWLLLTSPRPYASLL